VQLANALQLAEDAPPKAFSKKGCAGTAPGAVPPWRAKKRGSKCLGKRLAAEGHHIGNRIEIGRKSLVLDDAANIANLKNRLLGNLALDAQSEVVGSLRFVVRIQRRSVACGRIPRRLPEEGLRQSRRCSRQIGRVAVGSNRKALLGSTPAAAGARIGTWWDSGRPPPGSGRRQQRRQHLRDSRSCVPKSGYSRRG